MTFFANLLAAVLAAAPHGSSYAPESGEQLEARYASIVQDAILVGRERPLPGLSARQTAVVLLAVAHRESGFAGDVDAGKCADTARGRCDRGRAVCLLQVQARSSEERAELAGDRRACFRRGLAILAAGHSMCRKAPYAVFAGGMCESAAAVKGSKEIAGFVRRWMTRVEGGT